MKIIPFTTQSVDVRVINSKIGPVVPLVDVANAIGYEARNLHRNIENSKEMFEGTSIIVTMTQVNENRGTMSEQRRNVTALNSYGVVGLLMKLDYNRIKDPEKKRLVLKFQRWAMETLGKKLRQAKKAEQPVKVIKSRPAARKNTIPHVKPKKSNNSTFTLLKDAPVLTGNIPYYTLDNAAKWLELNKRTLLRYVNEGLITGYQRSIGRLDYWVVKCEDVEKLKRKIWPHKYTTKRK